jgi:hypothetical protein
MSIVLASDRLIGRRTVQWGEMRGGKERERPQKGVLDYILRAQQLDRCAPAADSTKYRLFSFFFFLCAVIPVLYMEKKGMLSLIKGHLYSYIQEEGIKNIYTLYSFASGVLCD